MNNAGWPSFGNMLPAPSVPRGLLPGHVPGIIVPTGAQVAGMVGMGDYVAPLPNRVLRVKGANGPEPLGPTDAPIRYDEEPSGCGMEQLCEWLRLIHKRLKDMPRDITHEWRYRFLQFPREGISFWVPASVVVATATPTTVLSITVDAHYSGFITHIGLRTDPVGALALSSWSLRFAAGAGNGLVHPRFDGLLVAANTTGVPIPFPMEIVQGQTIELIATQTTGSNVTMSGIFVGWTEYLADYKKYGGTPATGLG